jgi:ATP-dependent helicase/nuclease subunit A
VTVDRQELADQHARDRIRNDLDVTLIVEAAAGTGKTTALVNRIVSIIASGRATLDRIVAVTFTEKAAGELKLRLRTEIERARGDGASFDETSRLRLTSALPQLEEARIGTIHSFCADLLRERPVEAGVDPMFEVAPEDITSALFETAFERWFQDTLADPGPGVRRVLRRRGLADRDGPRPILRAAAWELLAWRDFDAPWRHESFDRNHEIDKIVEEIGAIGELAADHSDPDDWLRRSLERIARPLSEALRLEVVRLRDHDALEDTLLRLLRGNQNHWGWKGRGEHFGHLPRVEMLARRGALKQRLSDFSERAGANLAPMLRDEVWPVVSYYSDLKHRSGRLDFLDLLLIARDMVRCNAIVRTELQARFSHIFVDEFQDTDPLQAEILLLLAAADPAASDWLELTPQPGKLFIVSDPKQSIYRFRRADVALYQNVKQRLLARGAQLEHLTVSFRATPAIQQMVNAAFAPLMAAESSTQPAYVALSSFRADFGQQPAVVALPVPDPYSDYGRITNWSIDKSLPDAAAAFINWIVTESGWTVTEREAPERRVPIQPRHICILFRRLNSFGRDVTRPYVRALEARHIAHVLVRGGSFNEREEVAAIRNALGAIERPDDELTVYAVLRGPLFALTDGALLRFRETYRSLHPFRRIPEDAEPEFKEVGSALGVLRGLNRGRNRRAISDTIAQLLAATRAHAGIAIWPTGEQALANVMRLMDMARRYEAGGAMASLRGFVDELEARAEREEAGDAPVVEEGTEGVRIMTVHSAKGLEFSVVLMADLTCNETARQARRFVDPAQRLCAQMLAGCAPRELLDHREEEERRDEEEAIRVLYVAATRARDLVVVPVVGDERHDGWLGKLSPAIYPDPNGGLVPLERKPPGCPEFNAKYVGRRAPSARGNPRGIAPGMHHPEAGDHRVVWWDPLALKLDVRETMGLRQTKLLEADAEHKRSAAGRREYEAWDEARKRALAAGARPALHVGTATEFAAADSFLSIAEAEEIHIEKVPRSPQRPHGARFGTLVHAMLARIALDARRAEVAAAADFYARITGAAKDEVAAAVEATLAALASPLMRRASRAAELRRESAISLTMDDGTLIEGIADLAFAEGEHVQRRWTVVDFKTDVEIAGRLGEYRIQLALYLRGIRRATGLPTDGIILWI